MAETVLDKLVTILGFSTDLSGLRRFDDKVRTTRKRLDGLSAAGFNVGRQLIVAGGVVAGAFGLAAKQAIQWESDFTGVRKTVNATEEEFAALEKRLRQMAREEVPISAGDLARLAELAGQLGIETANIDEFVKVIAQLGTTTNITSEEGAQALARFANITGMAQGDFDRMGATIVDLGNNFATTEQEIIGMALRLAGAGELVGLTEAQILSISTALTSVGINAEAGGTAFSRVFVEMDKAVKEGGDTLDAFAKVVGKSGGEFAGTFTLEGADKAIVEFISGLQQIEADGGNVHTVLEELGFDTVRIRDALLRSAGAGDLMAEAMAAGTKAWEENVALTREAELRYGTMASRFQFAKNRGNDLAITVGGTLAPILTNMVDRLEPLIKRVNEFAEAHPAAVKWAAALALGVTGLGVAFIALAVLAKAASIILGGFTAVTAVARGGIWLYRIAILATRAQMFLLNAQLAIARVRQLAMIAPTAIGVAWINLHRNALLATRAQLLLFNIQMVAMRAVQIAGAIATGVMTGAQWLLNIALTANPIGIVIVLIAGLIAGLVALYLKSEKFRAIVQLLWGWLKKLWPILLGPLGLAIKGFMELYKRSEVFRNILQSIWQAAKKVGQFLGKIPGFGGGGGGDVDQLSAADQQGLNQSIGDLDSSLGGVGGGFDTSALDLDALTTLPIGPAPQPVGAGAGNGGAREFTIHIDRIEIVANGGDPEQIAAGVEDALARQVRALVEEADTRVRV